MVLLIDSDVDFRAALAANLLDDGHRVAAFTRPSEVALPHPERLTLLVLDHETGGMGALDFADRFHATHPDVPVVLTGTYWSSYLESAATARPFLILQRKPMDYEQLAALLPAPRSSDS